MSVKFTVVIPARYASTRLPGKPLLDIAGKPMIQHVYERALQSGADKVIIATDDDKVAAAATAFGADVCMTDENHRSGTERLAEVIDKRGLSDDTILVNLQGDEPLMPPALVHQVAADLDAHPDAVMATLSERVDSAAQLFDPNVVKVVTDGQGYAVYFSRAPIPWHRDEFAHSNQTLPEGVDYFRHIGLYAYRAKFVKQYLEWPACPLETIESLEQLRVLWQGCRIYVAEAAEKTAPGVDTQQDLEAARQVLEKAV